MALETRLSLPAFSATRQNATPIHRLAAALLLAHPIRLSYTRSKALCNSTLLIRSDITEVVEGRSDRLFEPDISDPDGMTGYCASGCKRITITNEELPILGGIAERAQALGLVGFILVMWVSHSNHHWIVGTCTNPLG